MFPQTKNGRPIKPGEVFQFYGDSTMELPPMPEPDCTATTGESVYSPERLQAYAREAVLMERQRIEAALNDGFVEENHKIDMQWAILAERERCAQICEQLLAFDEDNPGRAPADHIRLGAEPGEWIDDYLKRAAAIRATDADKATGG